jgi:peptidoglycan/xylan/chitin deacetylase (PgdA/CDA1 family)
MSRTVVLAYHGVGSTEDEHDPNGLILSPDRFASQIAMLRRLGFGFATAEELLDGRPRGRTAVLTFDDGWASSLDEIAPILGRFGARGTFYVNPGLWGIQHPDVQGPPGRLLDREGALALLAAGMELGSHTMSHPNLTTLDDAELARELSDSKRAVEDLTGRPCRTFAYPYGKFDGRVSAAAEAAGYELAFAWRPGPWRQFEAPRLPAPPRHGGGRLLLKLLGVRRRRAA